MLFITHSLSTFQTYVTLLTPTSPTTRERLCFHVSTAKLGTFAETVDHFSLTTESTSSSNPQTAIPHISNPTDFTAFLTACTPFFSGIYNGKSFLLAQQEEATPHSMSTSLDTRSYNLNSSSELHDILVSSLRSSALHSLSTPTVNGRHLPILHRESALTALTVGKQSNSALSGKLRNHSQNESQKNQFESTHLNRALYDEDQGEHGYSGKWRAGGRSGASNTNESESVKLERSGDVQISLPPGLERRTVRQRTEEEIAKRDERRKSKNRDSAARANQRKRIIWELLVAEETTVEKLERKKLELIREREMLWRLMGMGISRL